MRGWSGEGGAHRAPPWAGPVAARVLWCTAAPAFPSAGSRAALGPKRRRRPGEGRPPDGRGRLGRPGGGEGAWRGAGARRAGVGRSRRGAAGEQPPHLLPGTDENETVPISAQVAGRAARRRGRGVPAACCPPAEPRPPSGSASLGRAAAADLSPST